MKIPTWRLFGGQTGGQIEAKVNFLEYRGSILLKEYPQKFSGQYL